MIISNAFIAQTLDKGAEFSQNIHKVIEQFQEKGLVVEIQYQINNDMYSALILGRKK